jgi:tetratricopeptide (TPR) repeat protein
LIGEREEHGGGGLIRASVLLYQARSHLAVSHTFSGRSGCINPGREQLDQSDLAAKVASESIVLNPNSYAAFDWRANAYIKLKDYDAAISDTQKAIQLCTQTGTTREVLESKLKNMEILLTKDHYSILGAYGHVMIAVSKYRSLSAW